MGPQTASESTRTSITTLIFASTKGYFEPALLATNMGMKSTDHGLEDYDAGGLARCTTRRASRPLCNTKSVMRLGIATKVFIAFAGVTLIFSIVLMFGVYRTQMLHGQLRALNHRIVPLTLQLSDIENDLKSFHIVLNENDPTVLRRTLQLTRLLNTMPDNLGERLENAAATADLSALPDVPASEARAFSDIHRQIVDLERRGADFSDRTVEFSALVLAEHRVDGTEDEDIAELQEELREEARRLDTRLAAVRGELQSATDEALVRADDTERTSVYGLGLLSIIALIIALFMMYVVIVTLRPLTDLTEAAKRIGKGDYRPLATKDRPIRGGDEIALLTREFNAMAHRLAERDERLRAQHAELLKSERLATIGRMTSLITHELRNPLSSINLNAEMLMDSLHERGIDPDDPEVMPQLQTIIEEVDHLRDITEEYLVYARLPSPDLRCEDLDDIVQSLIDFHIWEWNQDQVDVELTVNASPIKILGDAHQLRQALLNIIKNAVEASDPEDTVEILVSRQNDRAIIRVSDDGAGMSEDARQRLFEPFFTTKSSGTGLGLPMTQQIIEQHRGSIDIDSSPGVGTTFTISLPLTDDASSHRAPHSKKSVQPTDTGTSSAS